MDKHELNIRVEELKRLVIQGDYKEAMQIADEIDWRRVHNASLLSTVSEVYENMNEYTEAKELLLLAYERVPVGKHLLYRLTKLALKAGDIAEAEAYYKEFYELAPDDSRMYILRYLILKAKDMPMEQRIAALENYNSRELDEKWLYELALNYHEAGLSEQCVNICDKIMLMFGFGKYVDNAMILKTEKEGMPLTEHQQGLLDNREYYEERFKSFENNYSHEVQIVEEDKADAEPESYNDMEDNSDGVGSDYNGNEAIENVETGTLHAEAEDIELKVAESEATEAKTDGLKTSEYEEYSEAEHIKIEEDDQEGDIEEHHVELLFIEALTPEEGLELAKKELKTIYNETTAKNKVAKIKASKLNQTGLKAIESKLSGMDLLIEEAGDLSDEVIADIIEQVQKSEFDRYILLIDNPIRIGRLKESKLNVTQEAPLSVDDIVEEEDELIEDPQTQAITIEPINSQVIINYKDDEDMDVDAFVAYASEYASNIDCVIPGKDLLALYERAELMQADGEALTKEAAANLIEGAADRAERANLFRRLFRMGAKYNKEGLLIIKEEHILS